MNAIIPATGVVDRSEFMRRLGERFPDVAGEIDDTERGLVHLEMAVFAHATSAAIDADDALLVGNMLSFAEEILRDSDSAVENAIYVSYLENVFLGETRAQYLEVRRQLPPLLSKGLAELEEHCDRLEIAAKAGARNE